ncbi:hypothetical protein WMY93_009278 [Mugilogobius chulae]|uniref:Caspase-3 n=1 Tax=Mugilogobius chulae TaxID=88201 RepID=A0AAW0PB31_9GOBI
MDYNNMGRCVIINNEIFTSGDTKRCGTDVDAGALKETFEKLGYKVSVHKDLTRKQMRRLMQDVAEEDHSKKSSFVCAILSHGTEEGIMATDKLITLEELTSYIKGDECRSLCGKPKLFFLQACRGTDVDVGVDAVDAAPPPTKKMIPIEADFLYAYATPPGYYAWRNECNGSWFIQSLCDILPRHKHRELMQIMTRVNRKVAYDFQSCSSKMAYDAKKVVPCITSMLTKDFYFAK